MVNDVNAYLLWPLHVPSLYINVESCGKQPESMFSHIRSSKESKHRFVFCSCVASWSKHPWEKAQSQGACHAASSRRAHMLPSHYLKSVPLEHAAIEHSNP